MRASMLPRSRAWGRGCNDVYQTISDIVRDVEERVWRDRSPARHLASVNPTATAQALNDLRNALALDRILWFAGSNPRYQGLLDEIAASGDIRALRDLAALAIEHRGVRRAAL